MHIIRRNRILRTTPALRELVEFGGALTRNLLGFRDEPDSGTAGMGFGPR